MMRGCARTRTPLLAKTRQIGRRSICSDMRPRLVLKNESVLIATLPVTPFQMNQYLIGCPKTGAAALVDCGDGEPERWVQTAAEHSLTIQHLLQTHAHVDHVAGLAVTKALLPDAPVYLHPDDYYILKTSPAQGVAFGFSISSPPSVEVDLSDGQMINVGDLSLRVLHTPGHAPGHVCFHLAEQELLFVGDLIFRGSIGRTDFPGCNQEDMTRSLRRILTLPPATRLFPGHMEDTTLAVETKSNPFLVELKV